MPPPSSASHIQECSNCGALLDVTSEEPFSLMHCPTCGAAMRVRRRFDHFEIQEELGAGGMGTVYRALDTHLNRQVALKLLQRQHSGDPVFVAQFQKEAAITASINHPHVVKVYSTGKDNGLVYIAMELVDKGSLESLMHTQEKVAELQILTMGVQVAQGLQAALDKGLIHRDIKPGNILFANAATAKIVDFGLAILAEHAGTVAGEIWATPFYVSPETVQGKKEDFRSDMYSLGATLYHAITGQPPHNVETSSMSALAAAKKAPVDILAVAPETSAATAFVLNKALNYDPNQRHQSYKDLIESLEYARTELAASLTARENAQAGTAEADARDWSWLTPVVALVVVVLGVAGFNLRNHSYFKPPVAVEPAEEVPQTAERIDAKYEEARRLLAAGDLIKASEALTTLDAKTTPPQPLRNWITLHASLAELLRDNEEAARQHLQTILDRGIYSPDPAEQELAQFFVDIAKRCTGKQPIKLESLTDIDQTSYEALAYFFFAVHDWSIHDYDDAWHLFRQYTRCIPQERHAWTADYKKLATAYLVEINAFRGARDTADAANSLTSRQHALQLVEETRKQIKLPGRFRGELKKMATALAKNIAEEQEEVAQRMSATEAADVQALADAQTRIAPLWQQFRLADALAVARAVQTSGEKGQKERDGLVKRMEWLARFKATLINDLNTVGYPNAVTKKTGGQIPGPVRRANETQIETVTPFGSLPALWTDLAPEAILSMSKSFLHPSLEPEVLADRQWLLGVYAMQAGRPKEGRENLIQASQVKESYREDLEIFLETAE